MREITGIAAVERSLVKRFRKELWQPFIAACKRYALVPAGCHAAAVLDGTSASATVCMLMRELKRHSDVPFDFTILDIGAGPAWTTALGIDALPCAGTPEEAAGACGADRLVVPDCMSDVTETVFGSMLYEGTLRAFLPLETAGEGPARIRPLYCVDRRDILAFCRYNGLPYVPRPMGEAAKKARELLDGMRKTAPNLEISIFRAAHQVHIGTFPPQREG